MHIDKIKALFTGFVKKPSNKDVATESKDTIEITEVATESKDTIEITEVATQQKVYVEDDARSDSHNAIVTESKVNTQTTVDQLLQKAVREIPECLAGGYIDIDTGMLLSLATVDSHPSEVMDLLAAATSDLFQGENVIAIETIFKKSRGIEDENLHYFKEILIMSENLLHIFIRGKKHSDYVVTFVYRNSVNQGLALTKARHILPSLEAAL